jgi:hypothetical protein
VSDFPQPFGWLPERVRQRILVGLGIGVAAFGLLLDRIGHPLRTEAAPSAIISFELAGTPGAAAAMLASWQAVPGALEAARTSLWLDYLFLLAYPVWLSLVCSAVARHSAARTAAFGAVCAWTVLAAAPLDAVENAALLRTLADPSSPWPELAWLCAVPKFALVMMALAYVAFAGPSALLQRLRSPEGRSGGPGGSAGPG